MATVGELSCLTTTSNVGVGACFFDPKNIIGALIVPKKTEIDMADPLTNIMAGCLASNKAVRYYPVFDFQGFTDGSEKRITQTLGYGARKTVREGFYIHSFQYVKGGASLNKALRTFNGEAWDFFYIDANMTLIGLKSDTSGKLKAIPTDGGEIWTDLFKFNDGSKITEYMIDFVFHGKTFSDNLDFCKLDFDAAIEIYGIEDVNITGAADVTSGSYDVTLKTPIGTNLGDLYPTELASASLWTATNFETGATVTITGVTYSATNKYFIVACDKNDADYPGNGQHIYITLKSPSLLDAAGVTGYEAVAPVKIAKN